MTSKVMEGHPRQSQLISFQLIILLTDFYINFYECKHYGDVFLHMDRLRNFKNF